MTSSNDVVLSETGVPLVEVNGQFTPLAPFHLTGIRKVIGSRNYAYLISSNGNLYRYTDPSGAPYHPGLTLVTINQNPRGGKLEKITTRSRVVDAVTDHFYPDVLAILYRDNTVEVYPVYGEYYETSSGGVEFREEYGNAVRYDSTPVDRITMVGHYLTLTWRGTFVTDLVIAPTGEEQY